VVVWGKVVNLLVISLITNVMDYASPTFHRKENIARGTENGPLRLCNSYIWNHLSSGKNQGKPRANQSPSP